MCKSGGARSVAEFEVCVGWRDWHVYHARYKLVFFSFHVLFRSMHPQIVFTSQKCLLVMIPRDKKERGFVSFSSPGKAHAIRGERDFTEIPLKDLSAKGKRPLTFR